MQAMYYIEKIVGKENFEGFIKEFKELGVKYHYYTILVDKLEKIK